MLKVKVGAGDIQGSFKICNVLVYIFQIFRFLSYCFKNLLCLYSFLMKIFPLKGIMQLIRMCEPQNVMLVHGEAVKMDFLKAKINKVNTYYQNFISFARKCRSGWQPNNFSRALLDAAGAYFRLNANNK